MDDSESSDDDYGENETYLIEDEKKAFQTLKPKLKNSVKQLNKLETELDEAKQFALQFVTEVLKSEGENILNETEEAAKNRKYINDMEEVFATIKEVTEGINIERKIYDAALPKMIDDATTSTDWNSSIVSVRKKEYDDSKQSVEEAVLESRHLFRTEVEQTVKASYDIWDYNLEDNLDIVAVEQQKSYVCPLTQKPFVNPVRALNGFVFEKSAIERLIEQNGGSVQCPVRGNSDMITLEELVEDVGLRKEMERRRQSGQEENVQLDLTMPNTMSMEVDD